MTAREALNLYLEFLREAGYRPEIDRDVDIKFKSEGRWHYVMVDRDAPTFGRLVYPNLLSLGTVEERRRAIAAAGRATAETKVAKVYPAADNAWAASEMLCSPPETFKAVFARAIPTLKTASSKFAVRKRKVAVV